MRYDFSLALVLLLSSCTLYVYGASDATTKEATTEMESTNDHMPSTVESSLPLIQPSIRTENGGVVVTIPHGAGLTVRTYDDSGEIVEERAVAYQDSLDALTMNLMDEIASLRTQLQDQISTVQSGLTDLINTKASQVEVDALSDDVDTKATESSVANRFQTASNERQDLQSQINTKASITQVETLEDEVDDKAEASRVEDIEDRLIVAWPEFQDFTENTQGWTGANVAVTECGDFGKILGGYGRTAGNTIMTRTFDLPVHSGVRIELDFIFIDSWDGEQASVLVDGQPIWTHNHKFDIAESSHGDQCGRSGRYSENLIHVDVTLWDHTKSTLTLQVRTTLQNDATDESFAIDNVFIHAASPQWPNENFEVSGEGWNGADISTCGIYGDVLGAPGDISDGDSISKTFIHLPSHDGVQLQMDILHLDEWADGEKVLVYVDDRLVWSTKFQDLRLIGQICATGNKNDFIGHVDVALPWHTSQVLDLMIVSNLAASSAKSFSIGHVTVGPMIASWPELDTFEAEDPTNNGWISNGPLEIQTCGSFGSILGGYNVLGRGRYVEKTFDNLPSHQGLQITLDFLYIDSWDNERGIIFVDGQEVWVSGPSTGGRSGSAEICGATNSGWREFRETVTLTIWDHQSSQVTIRVTTTLDGGATDESFGIDNVRITEAVRTWPDVDDFETGIDGWGGVSTSDRASCGVFGTLLGGPGKLGANRFVQKTFSNLPDHKGLMVELDFIYIDSWDGENARVYVDGQLLFDRQQRGGVSAQCGSNNGGWTEETDHVQLVLSDHIADSVTIRVTTTLDSSPNDEAWGIDNVKISPLEFSWPTTDVFDTSYHGWSGSSRSNCGGITIYGGYNVAGQNVVMSKTFNNLPTHEGLQIDIDFWFIDTWDGESAIIRVDGREVYRQSHRGGQGFNRCGRGDADVVQTLTVNVPGHTASSARVEVTTSIDQNPDDEAFGFTNFRLRAG